MRTLVRAAAYLPQGTAQGVRWAAPDEDVFTLLAAALDRVLDPSTTTGPPATVVIASPLPDSFDWAIVAFMGAGTRIERPGEGARPLADLLREAATGSVGDCIVVAAEAPSPTEGETPKPPGHGAVALRFRETEGVVPPTAFPDGKAGETPLVAAFELHRSPTDSSAVEWPGDWGADPKGGVPADGVRWQQARNATVATVSQGAYIPSATYRESIASRWRFEGERCPRCDTITFPSRGSCSRCANRQGLARAPLPRGGLEVVATTRIGPGGQPTEFDAQVDALGPYQVVLAELAPGIRVTLQVAEAEAGDLRIGDRVDAQLRRLYPMEGEWRYGRKAVHARRR
jgi:uncharacterized OB-fold protein